MIPVSATDSSHLESTQGSRTALRGWCHRGRGRIGHRKSTPPTVGAVSDSVARATVRESRFVLGAIAVGLVIGGAIFLTQVPGGPSFTGRRLGRLSDRQQDLMELFIGLGCFGAAVRTFLHVRRLPVLLTVSSTHLNLVAMGPAVRSIPISEITAVTRVPVGDVPKAERSKHLSDSALRIEVSNALPHSSIAPTPYRTRGSPNFSGTNSTTRQVDALGQAQDCSYRRWSTPRGRRTVPERHFGDGRRDGRSVEHFGSWRPQQGARSVAVTRRRATGRSRTSRTVRGRRRRAMHPRREAKHARRRTQRPPE